MNSHLMDAMRECVNQNRMLVAMRVCVATIAQAAGVSLTDIELPDDASAAQIDAAANKEALNAQWDTLARRVGEAIAHLTAVPAMLPDDDPWTIPPPPVPVPLPVPKERPPLGTNADRSKPCTPYAPPPPAGVPVEVLRTLHPVRRIIDRAYRKRHRGD